MSAWPHAAPPNPLGYAAAIATVLEDYPLGVVHECCNPKTGLAREREFPPTPASVVEWCNRRQTYHRGMVKWADHEEQKRRDAAIPRVDKAGVPWIERLRDLLRAALKAA